MREQGSCGSCGYPIERQRMERSIAPETNDVTGFEWAKFMAAVQVWADRNKVSIDEHFKSNELYPVSYTYQRDQWYEYYADDKKVLACPGCHLSIVGE